MICKFCELPFEICGTPRIASSQLNVSFNLFRYRGTYCSQEVAIKVLKPERVSAEMLREFSQEVYIMRSVKIYA